VFDVQVQLGRLVRQDLQGHQEHPEGQDQLVCLDPKEGEVFQAVQANLEDRVFLEIQVINQSINQSTNEFI